MHRRCDWLVFPLFLLPICRVFPAALGARGPGLVLPRPPCRVAPTHRHSSHRRDCRRVRDWGLVRVGRSRSLRREPACVPRTRGPGVRGRVWCRSVADVSGPFPRIRIRPRPPRSPRRGERGRCNLSRVHGVLASPRCRHPPGAPRGNHPPRRGLAELRPGGPLAGVAERRLRPYRAPGGGPFPPPLGFPVSSGGRRATRASPRPAPPRAPPKVASPPSVGGGGAPIPNHFLP